MKKYETKYKVRNKRQATGYIQLISSIFNSIKTELCNYSHVLPVLVLTFLD